MAKTLAVKTLAQTLAATFRRVQFTPDLLPADLIGTNMAGRSLQRGRVMSISPTQRMPYSSR